MTARVRSVIARVALAAAGGLAAPAAGFELGPLVVDSAPGQALSLVIELATATPEALETRCFRIRDPVAPATRLRVEIESDRRGSRLRLTSREPVRAAQLRFVVDAACGPARAWEYRVPLPAADPPSGGDGLVGPGRWRIAPGESLETLAAQLFPADPGRQAGFLAAVRSANPGIVRDGDIAAGTEFVVPDIRRIEPPAPAARPRRAVAAPSGPPSAALPAPVAPPRPAAGSDPGLRLATALGERPDPGPSMRELLRMEYRLVAGIALATAGQRELIEALRELEQREQRLRELGRRRDDPRPGPVPPTAAPAVRPPAGEPDAAIAAAPPARPAPPTAVSPPVARQAPPMPAPDPLGKVPADLAEGPGFRSEPWLPLAAGLAILGLLLGFRSVARRRSRRVVDGPDDELDDVAPPTILAGFPEPAAVREPAPASAPPVAGRPGLGVRPGDATDTPTLAPDGVAPPAIREERNVVELAELMLGFGRVKGAAALLGQYIGENPREALKPWTLLLDIYRRAGMVREFEDAAQRLHAAFNVKVEEWDASASLSFVATSITDFPHVVDRVCAAWRTREGIEYLRLLLRDNREGERAGFTREVAEEISMLAEILEADPDLATR